MAAGDEITGVNGRSIKGKTKVEVAKMIQEVKVRPCRSSREELALEWEAEPVRFLLSYPGCQGPSRLRVTVCFLYRSMRDTLESPGPRKLQKAKHSDEL